MVVEETHFLPFRSEAVVEAAKDFLLANSEVLEVVLEDSLALMEVDESQGSETSPDLLATIGTDFGDY